MSTTVLSKRWRMGQKSAGLGSSVNEIFPVAEGSDDLHVRAIELLTALANRIDFSKQDMSQALIHDGYWRHSWGVGLARRPASRERCAYRGEVCGGHTVVVGIRNEVSLVEGCGSRSVDVVRAGDWGKRLGCGSTMSGLAIWRPGSQLCMFVSVTGPASIRSVNRSGNNSPYLRPCCLRLLQHFHESRWDSYLRPAGLMAQSRSKAHPLT